MGRKLNSMGRFLSLILRHRPQTIRLTLDENGWADVEELIHKVRTHGRELDPMLLSDIVTNNDKKRFVFSEDGTRVSASQGHSLEIDLGLESLEPQEVLYHGTARKYFDSIRQHGLMKKQRHHVHLSSDIDTATKVGSRHGEPVVFKVHAGRMHRDGFVFYRSANGVWLTDHIPYTYMEHVDRP